MYKRLFKESYEDEIKKAINLLKNKRVKEADKILYKTIISLKISPYVDVETGLGWTNNLENNRNKAIKDLQHVLKYGIKNNTDIINEVLSQMTAIEDFSNYK